MALDLPSPTGGYLCRDFGEGGVVDLTLGIWIREPGYASNTSGATVAGGLLLIGQQASDYQRRDAPSGVMRAYGAITGELRWAWDALRPDPETIDASYLWSITSIDAAICHIDFHKRRYAGNFTPP